MGLPAYTPETTEIPLPRGGGFSVNGLSLEDITALLRSHYPTMKHLFDRFIAESTMDAIDREQHDGLLGLADPHGLILEVLEKAPAFIADVIARGAGETKHPERARTLPPGVQIAAVEAIARLTLEAEGGMEKLLETVLKVAGSLTSLTANRSP